MDPVVDPVGILLVEDSDDDALLLWQELRQHHAPVRIERVATATALERALAAGPWDVVISDYTMPAFDGLAALRIVRDHDADLPFIIVSATIGEAIAVAAMRAGAADYVMKRDLARLLPAVQRELREAVRRREQQARIHFLANYDPVTMLANRKLFIERLSERVAQAAEAGRRLAVAVIGVDRFDLINASLGRKAGDALLARLGTRLAHCLGDSRCIARLEADRFAVMHLESGDDERVALATAEQMRCCFGEPFSHEGREYRLDAKAGIAVFPVGGTDPHRLLGNAEAALARAKESEERCVFYTAPMTARIAERLLLESRLRQALDHGEFELHYQPKVSLHDGGVTGAEALIRWRSPELGLVYPANFIPLLEETGMIVEVGTWVLAQAVRDQARWREQGLVPPRVSVNVSVLQLHRLDFVAVVREAVRSAGTPPAIELEITESMLVGDVDANVAKLSAIRDLGLTIAIDDFGTGYSSLSYLVRMPVDSVKIDRSFVCAMLTDTSTRTLVATIVNMAHSLGLTTVAEGVESADQAKALRELGCDEIQGYFSGRPLPYDRMAETLGRRLRERTASPESSIQPRDLRMLPWGNP